MLPDIDRGIEFSICGRFAHFRKFYTNSSSLTYLVPPRTVVSGIIASILKIPRNQYYDLLGKEKVGLSVAIPPKLELRRQMQSMNNLHNKYFNLISKGTGEMLHSQCKLELLGGAGGAMVKYIIFAAFNSSHELLNTLETKLRSNDLGYGVYLGQRQFRAQIKNVKCYTEKEMEFLEKTDFIDSVCLQENIQKLELSDGIDICKERMPSGFSANTTGREACGTSQVVFEKNGHSLHGEFLDCCKVGERCFSFY